MDRLKAFINTLPEMKGASYIDIPSDILKSFGFTISDNYLHIYERVPSLNFFSVEKDFFHVRGIRFIDTKIPVIFWEDYLEEHQ